MMDVEKLKRLLAEYDDALADYDRSSPLSKGVLDDVWAELSAEAVRALPHLLAIAEAAMALERNRNRRSRIWVAAVCDAVDAARKAGT